MTSGIPPIRSGNLDSIEPQKYRGLKEEGYNETYSLTCIYRGKQGQYVTLKQPVSACSRVVRMIGCIVAAPLSCVFTCLTCCKCDETTNPCIEHLYAPAMDGGYIEQGFVEDLEGTLALRKKDFNALGYESFDKESMAKLVQSKQFPTIRSTKYPQHFYMPFYGPITQLSYIIVIPYGNVEDVMFFTPSNEENKPCNSEEMRESAETLCGGYKPGVRKIQQTTESKLIGRSTYYGSFGSATGDVYIAKDKIVST
jgi:hypothetical protein